MTRVCFSGNTWQVTTGARVQMAVVRWDVDHRRSSERVLTSVLATLAVMLVHQAVAVMGGHRVVEAMVGNLTPNHGGPSDQHLDPDQCPLPGDQ